MRVISILIFLFTAFPLTCSKQESYSPSDNNSSMRIEGGFECGWGSGLDSLIITNSQVRYYYYVPSSSADPKIMKSRGVTAEEWAKISDAVDFSSFLKLDYNTCNICVDGCDEWIIITKDNTTHQIRYGKGVQIAGVEKLQEILAAYRSEFSQ